MDAFFYELPDPAIAQRPIEPRDAARLLVALDPRGSIDHRRVADLAFFLGPGDVLVVNDTRVLPARLRLCKTTGGAAEVLLLEPIGVPRRTNGANQHQWWRALVRPGRRVAEGAELVAPGDGTTLVHVGERLDNGCRAVELLADPWAYGHVPLPPYVHEPLAEPGRYQTVYATHPGSVAAPTAGLHLTEAVLARCRDRGVQICTVDLAIGLDTFRPIKVAELARHQMHSERYRVPPETMDACRGARRVVAIGTTVVRALEAAAVSGVLEGRTDLFIRGAYPFAIVDVLLTNFHLPRSTLLVLLDAFYGPGWRDLYAVALAEGYRFLSFGDAMIVSRR